MSVVPASTYECIARRSEEKPAEEIARFTGKRTRRIAEGLGGIGGVRVIIARDGTAREGGGVSPPFALLSIPDPWIAVVLSEMMHQEDVFTAMACRWALYPAGQPTERLLRLVGPEREHLLEPHELLWYLEPIPEGYYGGTAADWIEQAHEDCDRFEVKAAEMREAAEAFLAELREVGPPGADEDARRAHAAHPQWERALLPNGALLAALVSLRDVTELPRELRLFLEQAERFRQRALVPFTILEPLILAHTTSRRAALRPCRCEIAALQVQAESVNHAYTLITEAFQPTRRSTVGNVFREVAVQHSGKWTPLEELRKNVEAKVAAGR